jgi:hypothetical protein
MSASQFRRTALALPGAVEGARRSRRARQEEEALISQRIKFAPPTSLII